MEPLILLAGVVALWKFRKVITIHTIEAERVLKAGIAERELERQEELRELLSAQSEVKEVVDIDKVLRDLKVKLK